MLFGSSEEGDSEDGDGEGEDDDGDVVTDDVTSDVDVDDDELLLEQPVRASVAATTAELSATVERERRIVFSFP